jgi:hypothetical protein
VRSTDDGRTVVPVAPAGWGQEDRRRTREAGFNHHPVKPVEIAARNMLFAELGPL